MNENKCPKHKQHELKYLCLSNECRKALNCVFCIKNDHKNCNDDFIVEKADF